MLNFSESLIYEAEHWRVTHRLNSALPGYLMIGSKVATTALYDLPPEAHAELGKLLARTQLAVHGLQPRRIYMGRYGHEPGWPIHFHVIPIYGWVEDLFWRNANYRVLRTLSDPAQEYGPDGAELTLFVWREFCESDSPPQPEGMSVSDAIAQLRKFDW